MSEYISKKCLNDSQALQDDKIDAAIVKNTAQDIAITTLQNAQIAAAAGFNAAALSAIPLSTDATYGKSRSATPLETGAGVLNDGVHVSPADLLAAARTATTFAAAIAINPNKYGTFASVAAPTLAPSEANPQTILTNANQEVFAYTGNKWVLIADGYSENLSGSFTNSTFNSTAIYSTYTAQRAGKIIVETSAIASWASTTPNMYTLAVDSFGFGSISYSLDADTASFVKNSATIDVSAGQVINAGIYISAQNNTITGTGKMTITYIG